MCNVCVCRHHVRTRACIAEKKQYSLPAHNKQQTLTLDFGLARRQLQQRRKDSGDAAALASLRRRLAHTERGLGSACMRQRHEFM